MRQVWSWRYGHSGFWGQPQICPISGTPSHHNEDHSKHENNRPFKLDFALLTKCFEKA